MIIVSIVLTICSKVSSFNIYLLIEIALRTSFRLFAMSTVAIISAVSGTNLSFRQNLTHSTNSSSEYGGKWYSMNLDLTGLGMSKSFVVANTFIFFKVKSYLFFLRVFKIHPYHFSSTCQFRQSTKFLHHDLDTTTLSIRRLWNWMHHSNMHGPYFLQLSS